jgi:hypothetical protein
MHPEGHAGPVGLLIHKQVVSMPLAQQFNEAMRSRVGCHRGHRSELSDSTIPFPDRHFGLGKNTEIGTQSDASTLQRDERKPKSGTTRHLTALPEPPTAEAVTASEGMVFRRTWGLSPDSDERFLRADPDVLSVPCVTRVNQERLSLGREVAFF